MSNCIHCGQASLVQTVDGPICPDCVEEGYADQDRNERQFPEKIQVNRQALLDVVRKLDFGAPMSNERFAKSFDVLRLTFTAEELQEG